MMRAPFAAILVALFCAGFGPAHPASACEAVLTLDADDIPSDKLAAVQVEVLDESGNVLASAREGRRLNVRLQEPKGLYRRVIFRVTSDVFQPKKSDIVAFAAWPCDKPLELRGYLFASVDASSDEVAKVERLPVPNDLDSKGRHSAKTLAIAQERKQRADPNYYDLVSSYLTLRAFRERALASKEVTLDFPSELRPMKDWYSELLVRFDRGSNLGAYKRDRELLVITDAYTRQVLYTRKWEAFLTEKDRGKALAGMQRLLDSIRDEPDTEDLLASLRLSETVILYQISQIAGKATAANAQPTPEIQQTLSRHEQDLKKAIESPKTALAAKAKHKADLGYLAERRFSRIVPH